ncbi:uncharacterized protein LOC102809578 [Saccoglossus kowalevskii]|uniref:Uncharacterized protein LOC102809578 n=1 Tax=Saccoglossus kowalevskii TaxID=10224 RepID=A0ABM0LX32_SACKO|nr:PREDICTED: uncharacterized protein LOC102809578 [Saccoglossus kowalevskii]
MTSDDPVSHAEFYFYEFISTRFYTFAVTAKSSGKENDDGQSCDRSPDDFVWRSALLQSMAGFIYRRIYLDTTRKVHPIFRSMTTEGKEPTDDSTQPKALVPAVAQYGPCNCYGLKPGDTKHWCVCGLSKKQPWCDGSHKGTGFRPLKWTVPKKQQTLYQLCACKHTKVPPYCDATHTNLPSTVIARYKGCTQHHGSCNKLCTQCGWVPEF